MRKLKFVVLAVVALSLTSCWDFNRRQDFLNAENKGKSILIEAESSKKARIEEAKAEKESAELLGEAREIEAKAQARAEVARAHGVAEANRIIGESLKGNNEYLKYLQIDAIRNGTGDKIYIPTEAGIPILEARK